MKLYYTKGACSLVVRIISHELGLDVAYESVDLKTKKTESGSDYLTKNPKGAVPALLLENGDILTENAVILQYLADTAHATTLLPSVGNFNRYRVLEWLNYVSSELHKSFGPLFNPKIPKELKESLFIPIIKNKLHFVNTHLMSRPYLLGEHFTLPDAYLYVMLLWTSYFGIDLKE